MAWVELGTLEIIGDWRFTPPITGRLFRVRHLVAGDFWGRGLICQASGSVPADLKGVIRLFPKSEPEIFTFEDSTSLPDRRLAFRSYWRNTTPPWNIAIDQWQDSLFNPSRIAQSDSVLTLLQADDRRRGAIIYNSSPNWLTIDFDSFAGYSSGGMYIQPYTSINIPESYKGIVYGVWDSANPVGEAICREFL